ncbi:MAG: glycosyltransferase [Steroidobacteraceae bacterium]
MMARVQGPIAYVMNRYPRLSETFILNEIRVMERLGADLHIFSLLQPEPPPHHPMVRDVKAPVHALPARILSKLGVLFRAHGEAVATSPLRYMAALGHAALWSVLSPSPWGVWKQFVRAGFVATTCRNAGIRHIHAHFANAPAAVVHFASLMSGIPFSVTAHAKDLYLTPKSVIRRRARAATFVATCTGYNAHYLRDLLGADGQQKINLVYHGIDLSMFTADVREPESEESAFRLLSVGRLVPKKGHDDLIAACAELRDAGYEIRCRIVGGGPLKAELSAQIAQLGLEKVVSLEGSMTHAELIGLYRQADLFALAPRITEDGDRDGIPNVIAEAIAAGVPVVSTNVSGIPELVRHEQTGLLVPPNDSHALANAIARLIESPEVASALAASARALLETDFDLLKTTIQLHALMGCAGCGHSVPGACAVSPVAPVTMAVE